MVTAVTGPHWSPATGSQHVIVRGRQQAVVVALGGAIARYVVDGRDVLDGFASDELITGSRGMPLIPWPNRIEDGLYHFEGTDHQLPIDDVADGHAIHGLVRWVPWRLVAGADRVALETAIHPRPGYPFSLTARVDYRLGPTGLIVTTRIANAGHRRAPVGIGHHPYLFGGSERIDASTLSVPAGRQLLTSARRLPGEATDVEGTDTDFRSARPIGKTVLSVTYGDLPRDRRGRAWVVLDGTSVWLGRGYDYVMLFSGEDLADATRHRRSLAIEPMSCPPNAFRTGTGLRVLEPGDSFEAVWGIVPASLRGRRRRGG